MPTTSMAAMYMDHRYQQHHQQQQQLHARRLFQEWTLQFGNATTPPSARNFNSYGGES